MGVFKAYDVRGVYGRELDEELAQKAGNAFARFLGAKNIVVGRDMREAAIPIARALQEGICNAGANVLDIGLASTPMTYFSIGHLRADGGISSAC